MKALVFLAACAGPSDVTGTATISFDDQALPAASATFTIGEALEVSFFTAPANTPCEELSRYTVIGSLHLYPVPAGPPFEPIELIAENQAQLNNGGPIFRGQVDIYAAGADAVSGRLRGIDSTNRMAVMSFFARSCSD